MGNTSCRYMMKSDLRKESALYQNRRLLFFVSTFTAWYTYIQHHYSGVEKWYIMPIVAYVTSWIIIGSLIYLGSELAMNKYELNNRIYKCIQWQQQNKNNCLNKKFNKCIINTEQIKDWDPIPPKPVVSTTEPSPMTSTFKYYEPRQYTFPNFTQTANVTQEHKTNDNSVKPGNFYMN